VVYGEERVMILETMFKSLKRIWGAYHRI